MPKENHLEFKVGLFVLFALGTFTFLILSINETTQFKKGKEFRAVFSFASGLKKNAPVRVAGVDEGIVKNIKLIFDQTDQRTKAEVLIVVKKDVMIPKDSTFYINQLGLLGEKYVEIVPGVDSKQFLAEGQLVIGRDPISQEDLSRKVMDVAKKVETTIVQVNEGILKKDNLDSFAQTLKNISGVTEGMNDIVSYTREGQGTIGKLFYDDGIYNEVYGLTADLRANPWKLLYRPKNEKKKQ